MIRKLTLLAGFGAGYVLGAKAGTQRYDQIVTTARQLAGKPVVREVRSNLTDAAGHLGDRATAAVNQTVAAVADKVPDLVDLSRLDPAGHPPDTTPGPLPSGAPIVMAPDH